MTDEPGAVVLRGEIPALTPSEILTAEFYAWEKRGRGWQVWPYAVELEPPFRPFVIYVPAAPARSLDDARKPTLLSSLADAMRSVFRSAPAEPEVLYEEFTEPEAGPFETNAPLAEIQVSVPPTLKIAKDAAEQFLLSLGYCSHPLSFEVIGTAESVAVQFAAREPDRTQLRQQLKAHFPEAALKEDRGLLERCWDGRGAEETVIVEFGLSQEFVLPLRTFRGFDVDPLIAATGALGDLEEGEVAVLQALFQSVHHPWGPAILESVTDAGGRSFFADAPWILPLARDKVSRPLVAAVIRVGAKSPRNGRAWQIARALGGMFQQFANPQTNELIPLTNDGYDDGDHEQDLLRRTTHRSGILLNSDELVSIVHLPSASVRAEKLQRETKKTKLAPASATGHRLVLGENAHGGNATAVSVSPAHRTRHMHVIGASGTGKSHLLLNLIVQDLKAGEGIGVIDPHGDLIEKALAYVPDHRVDDVILFDPADEERPVGFNLLQASSMLERHLLASDLVAGFQRLSTTWGDQMTAVLSNAVLAILESREGGTIADLRRFLVDADFRRKFLKSVGDAEVVYFWEKEFPLLVGKPQGPILTRLNAFLRHRLVRQVVAQRDTAFDVARVMNEGKIFFAKLAQGQIGEENARLLGTLLLARFHQIALTRQEFAEEERRPFYLYVDEFHHFATPSLATMLSGARKYRLGLVLAHQDLEQLRSRNPELLSAVLTNPAVRVCFRTGDLDAAKL